MITKIINSIPVDGEIQKQCSVYIKDGKIYAITDEDLTFDEIIDAGGNYISAGWIDIHVHGGGGYDFMDGGVDAIIEGAKMHLKHGTTSIYPTTLSASQGSLMQAVKDISEAMEFPTVRGVHLEGPYFNPVSCGAQNTEYIRDFDKSEIDEIISYGIVRRWDYAPELADSRKITEYLDSKGVVCSIGHSDATYAELLPAFEKGCKHVTHLYSATSTIVRKNGYRHPGIIEAAFLLDDMTVEVIADGYHLPPVLLRMIYKIKGADKICLVTDAMRAAGMPDGEYILGSKKEGMLCIREDGVAKLPDRTAFAGSVATADRLVKVMYKDAGIPLPQVIQMITQTPAKIMKLETKGRLKVGYDADLVIFDDDINVKQVFVNGVKLHDEV